MTQSHGPQQSWCVSGECGRCRSCHARRAWAEGRHATDAQKRWNRWRPEEEDFLRTHANHPDGARGIAADYARAFPGHKRSIRAIYKRAGQLGIYVYSDEWTLKQLTALFGGHAHSISRHWLQTGLLPGRKLPPGRGTQYGEWRVAETDLETFIRSCLWAFDASLMRPATHRLARLAMDLQRRDPWWPGDIAAPALGLAQSTWCRWCQEGVIPAKRRHVGIVGGVHAAWVMRAADVPAAIEAIQQRRREAREFLTTNLVRKRRAWNEARRAVAA
jgi:hypothetical protein